MPKLKPCPFCGGEADIREPNIFYWGKVIVCEKCGVQMPPSKNNKEAIAAWNRRAGKVKGVNDDRSVESDEG